MLSHEFMRNAYLAGTFIALACGVAGWFVVLRGQVFAGDALSHVAFVGAIGAAAAGVDPRIGLFAATLAVAALLTPIAGGEEVDDVAIGIVFALLLGVGVLLLSVLSTSSSGGGTGVTGARTLFGSIFGLSAGEARLAATVGAVLAVAVLASARRLLFASVDPSVARARGLPLGALSAGFLVIVGGVAAEATQAVGALLLLGLLAAPAGAAHRLTVHPYRGIALSAGIAVGCVWGGLALAYAIGSLPPSTAIVGLAALSYAGAALLSAVGRTEGRDRAGSGASR